VSNAEANHEKLIQPDHREHREPEAGQGGADVPLGQQVRRLVPGGPEGDDEGQVEQPLQRGRETLPDSCGSRPVIGATRWARPDEADEAAEVTGR
jgi:hypothetical protein